MPDLTGRLRPASLPCLALLKPFSASFNSSFRPALCILHYASCIMHYAFAEAFFCLVQFFLPICIMHYANRI